MSDQQTERRFTGMLLAMIGDISNALGISEEDQACANGAMEIIAAIEELKSAAARLTGTEYDALMAAKDERDDLRAHLAGIEKIANQSRTQTARMLLIAGRCRSALNGDSGWRKLPRPRKRHPLATPENTQ